MLRIFCQTNKQSVQPERLRQNAAIQGDNPSDHTWNQDQACNEADYAHRFPECQAKYLLLIFDPSILDEAIETTARVLAGTDDRYERPGILGGTVYYAAAKVKDGYERADGKRFNMSYIPSQITGPEEKNQVIRTEQKE